MSALLWALWCPEAAAQSALSQLQQGMAEEVLYGDLEGARVRYMRLAQDEAVDGVARADAVFLWGRVLYDLGRYEEAREVLLEGIRSGTCPQRCRLLHETMEIDLASVDELPVTWTFDRANHGVFHPSAVQDLGSIKLALSPNGDPALMWTTTSQMGRSDRLVMGVRRPEPPPEVLELGVTSVQAPAVLRAYVVDEVGRLYGQEEPIRLAAGVRMQLAIRFEELIEVRSDLGVGEPASLALDRGSITRIVLEHATPLPQNETRQLYLHAVTIR